MTVRSLSSASASIAALVLIAGVAGLTAAGIKDTVRLTVSGSNLASPIEVTDGSVLALSNVFNGDFIGEAVDGPDDTTPRYTVTFDIQTAQGVKRGAYMVYFARSRWTNDAFVYLPGHGDPEYRRNISTILRPGQDGSWHRASARWYEALRRRVP
jgi:hypothetical protein